MNISTIALLFVAWQFLSNNKKSTPKLDDFAPLLNEQTRDILSCVQTLSSQNASQEDKTGAIFQMMTNPTVVNLAQKVFGENKKQQENTQSSQQGNFEGNFATQQECNGNNYSNDKVSNSFDSVAQNQAHLQNDEGYVFPSSSKASQEFFQPIENIADAEVKHKLYWFYDNWYLAK